jgi:hypothetical protein
MCIIFVENQARLHVAAIMKLYHKITLQELFNSLFSGSFLPQQQARFRDKASPNIKAQVSFAARAEYQVETATSIKG